MKIGVGVKTLVYSLITGEGNKMLYLLFRPLLLTLSFLYIAITATIKFLYRLNILKSTKPKAKVISIGNITWGGTGKTSLALLLGSSLSAANKKTAVLIRGYGSDENKMLKEQLPNAIVLSGRNRLKNAHIACDKYGAEVLILDDGFQHWRLKRDLDIVAINAINPFGNKKVIPAGILREPVSALKRSHMVIITKVNLVDKDRISSIKDFILSINPKAEIFEAEHRAISITDAKDNKTFGMDYINNKALTALSSLGDNESFFRMLSGLGAKIIVKLPYPDHHSYTHDDVTCVINAAKNVSSDAIITTAKDWVRLKAIMPSNTVNVLLLNIAAKIIDEDKFFNRIYRLLNT